MKAGAIMIYRVGTGFPFKRAQDDTEGAEGMRARAGVLTSVLALVALVVPACGCGPAEPKATPVPIDVSLLTGKPCEPPCWQGLTPGSSTEDDVNQFMETSKFVDRDSVFRGDITTASAGVVGVSVQWQSVVEMHGSKGWNSFHIEDGVVQSIETYLDFEVTLGELLDRYGPPTSLRAQYSPPPSVDAEITLFYPELGLAARVLLKPPEDHLELQPGSTVERVWYFSPRPLEELCDLSGAVRFPDKPEHIEIVLQPWEGYGPIELD